MRRACSPGGMEAAGRCGKWAPRRGSARGYTVLQLVIVLALAGIAIALALPALNSKPVNLRADLQDLSLNLQVAREFAQSRTQHYRVRVFASGPPYKYAVEGYNGAIWVPARTIKLRSNIVFLSGTLGLTAEFDTRGMLYGAAAPPLTFTLKDTARGWTKTVTVNAVGMVDQP